MKIFHFLSVLSINLLLSGNSFGNIIRVPEDITTIQAAIDVADNGDTVLVAHGTYTESIDFLGKAVVVSSHFIIDNDPAHIDCTVITPGGNGTGVNFSSGEDSSAKLIGFTITGCGGLNEAGVRCHQSSPFISNNHIIDNQCRAIILFQSRAILLENEIHGNSDFNPTPEDAIFMSQSGPIIEKNIIHAADPNGNISAISHGITVPVDTFEIIITNNVIIGRIFAEFFEGGPRHSIDHNLFLAGNSFSSAMNITGGDSGLNIINNTIIGGGGIWIQRGPGPHIRNNIIALAERGIQISSGFASIAHNDIWECNTPYAGLPDQTGINGNISENPRFVDENNHYHLLPSSPCIDAGDPNSEFSNEPEPNGGQINMGVYGGTLKAATSVPVVFVEPILLDFGEVPVDSSAQLSFDILNIGHDTLSVSAIISSSDAFTTDFTHSDSQISPSDTLGVIVTFIPTESRSYVDSLKIVNNDTTQIIILTGGIVTGVEGELSDTTIPKKFELFQNYPNPFNPTTTIQYRLPKASQVKLVIYNLLGHHVAILVDEQQSVGTYSVEWKGKDNSGREVASGVYLYRLEAIEFIQVRKLVLLR